MEKIVCKGKSIGGDIIIEITADDGQVRPEYLRGVRCGLSWPTAVSPGYYCLVGQLFERNPAGKYLLMLLREGQEQLVNSLFQKMADDLGKFYGEEIYSDLSENFRSYMIAFNQYASDRDGSQDLCLLPVPFHQSFVHGVSLIKEWKKDDALFIPEGTIVHNQLREMKIEDLKSNPQEVFYAINGLRYVMGAFETFPISPPERREASPPDNFEAWT